MQNARALTVQTVDYLIGGPVTGRRTKGGSMDWVGRLAVQPEKWTQSVENGLRGWERRRGRLPGAPNGRFSPYKIPSHLDFATTF